MSDSVTKRMLEVYRQMASPTAFFTRMFKPKFYNSEKVQIDIVRGEEDVAIVVQDMSAGYRQNAANVFTNKEFTAPVFKEAAPINSFELIKRSPGQDPFQEPDFQGNAIIKSFDRLQKIEAKIRRSVELQSSQVLQTGTVTLIDSTGAALYTIDYSPKATHFPIAPVAWDAVGDDKIGNLNDLANVIRADGLVDPKKLVFGDTAFISFMKDTAVQAILDNRRINIGTIDPRFADSGATFQGNVRLGNYEYEIWTYNGRFTHPQTGVSTQFMDPGKVVMLPDTPRFDGTFGGIPRIAPVDSRVLPFLPDRMNLDGVDIQTNAWLSKDGDTLFVAGASRPLMIPVAIDTFGCLDTQL